jgi:hypothetical protein
MTLSSMYSGSTLKSRITSFGNGSLETTFCQKVKYCAGASKILDQWLRVCLLGIDESYEPRRDKRHEGVILEQELLVHELSHGCLLVALDLRDLVLSDPVSTTR